MTNFKKNERPIAKHSLSFVARMVHLKPFFPHNTDILEVGCGEGFVAEVLIKNNCQVIGIDYSREAISQASKLPGKYIQVDVFKYQPKKKFSWIICSEVLEHLRDDKKALKLVYSWLKPGGKLLLSVPTFMKLTQRLKNSGHERHYEPSKLKDLISQIGFRVEKERQWGCLSRRLILGYLPAFVPRAPITLLSTFGKIFGPLVKLESQFWPFPDSIILLLKKPK